MNMKIEKEVGPMAKREMLPIRMDIHAKQVIANAAALMGTTINAFLVQQGYQAALKILSDSSHLQLSNRDWKAFMHALENPPKPNAKLKKLLARDK